MPACLLPCWGGPVLTYVAKEETHVARTRSPPISLSPGGLGGANPGGKAASHSAKVILSGSSSRMSTYSSACIR